MSSALGHHRADVSPLQLAFPLLALTPSEPPFPNLPLMSRLCVHGSTHSGFGATGNPGAVHLEVSPREGDRVLQAIRARADNAPN